MFRKFGLFLLCLCYGYGESVQLVPLSNKAISFKSKINNSDIRFVKANNKYKCKDGYVDLILLKRNKYYSKHYIGKNKVLCLKDVYIPTINKVNFRFGNLEIEKEAELIKETKSYIKIKNFDGTIEKIYTDGRN